MITFIEIVVILLIHWFADFVLQTDKEAKGKSKNWLDLLSHTITYSLIWVLAGVITTNPFFRILGVENCMKFILIFPVITFVAHTITDYYTSRLNSKLWQKGDTHNFFVSIGFDQILHYVQLFGSYILLKG